MRKLGSKTSFIASLSRLKKDSRPSDELKEIDINMRQAKDKSHQRLNGMRG